MTRTIEITLHDNATTDDATLIALVKLFQFRKEFAHILVSGIVAQIAHAKKSKILA